MDKNLDSKIVTELGKDGRRSNARLARDLGVSVATIAKRLNHLVQQGSIVFRAIPDPEMMGYGISAVIAIDMDLADVARFSDEFVNDVRITLIATTFGRFNLFLVMHFTEWNMLNDFLVNKVRARKSVHQVEVYFISEMTKRYHNFFDGNRKSAGCSQARKNHPTLDAVDKELIEALHKNGRLGFSDLGKKLSLSTTTVSRRITSLCKKKILEIVAIPNPSFFGNLSGIFILMNVDRNEQDAICRKLILSDNVHLLAKLANGFDLLVGVHCDTPEVLFQYISENIATIQGIHRMETLVRAQILKRTVYPELS